MYENIVKSLRHCAENDCSPECPRAGIGKGCISGLKREAADAIEELQKLIDGVCADNDSLCKRIDEMSKPRWIPVTEEPPLKVGDDDYNGYLVYANGYYEVADYTTDKFGNVLYFCVNGEYEPDVTHYMPLPEPPKEET